MTDPGQGLKLTAEARALAEVLLAQQAQVLRSEDSSKALIRSALIPYGDLCERARLPELKSTAGRYLREIADWCHENHWPPLNALAVNHESLRPGKGYDRAPGCRLDRWNDQVAACIRFAGYPSAIV